MAEARSWELRPLPTWEDSCTILPKARFPAGAAGTRGKAAPASALDLGTQPPALPTSRRGLPYHRGLWAWETGRALACATQLRSTVHPRACALKPLHLHMHPRAHVQRHMKSHSALQKTRPLSLKSRFHRDQEGAGVGTGWPLTGTFLRVAKGLGLSPASSQGHRSWSWRPTGTQWPESRLQAKEQLAPRHAAPWQPAWEPRGPRGA